jgi:hypothetical protein
MLARIYDRIKLLARSKFLTGGVASGSCSYLDTDWVPNPTGLCGIITQTNFGTSPSCTPITRSYDTGKTLTCTTVIDPYLGPITTCVCI